MVNGRQGRPRADLALVIVVFYTRANPSVSVSPTSPRAAANYSYYTRSAKLRGVETIVIGAGLGRCGTTNYAMNLQQQGWAVSHEAGNTNALDYNEALKDRFNLRDGDAEHRELYATNFIKQLILSKPGKPAIVGDVSHVHSQIMGDFLKVDERVCVTFLHNSDLDKWVASVVNHHPQGGRVETNLLAGRGIDATKFPDRTSRLKAYAKRCLTEAWLESGSLVQRSAFDHAFLAWPFFVGTINSKYFGAPHARCDAHSDPNLHFSR